MSNQSWKETATAVIGLMGIGLASNILTPLMACAFPRIKNLLGLKIQEVRVEHFPPEEWEEDIDTGRTPINSDLVHTLRCPEVIDIKYNSECISINLENGLLCKHTKDMTPYSFGFDSGGSGGLGLIVLGIPGTLVCLPLILLCNAAWHGVYKLTEMDVNYYLFFRRIKDQLPADTRAILKDALVKTSHQNKSYNE